MTDRLRRWLIIAAIAPLANACALTNWLTTVVAEDRLPSADNLLDALPVQMTADIPTDVDRVLLEKLKAAKELPREHLMFDILSWREFVAVCWPVNDDGIAMQDINDSGRKRFATWKTDNDIFLPDGGRPAPWGTNQQNRRFVGYGIRPGARVLDNISAVHGPLNTKPRRGRGEVSQAFAYPIWDRNGWMVRYEIYVNRDEFEYIAANELYNIDGQVAFTKAGGKVSFPLDVSVDNVGAIELKLAWKVLDESKGDLLDRFLTVKGAIFTGADGKQPVERTLALVGMHIGHRTHSSPQWIWSTFMHVDSLQTDALKTFQHKPINPLFVDPANEIALINTPAQTSAIFLDGQIPTQVSQVTPVPLATEQVNRLALSALRSRRSVLQYYKLLGTQWPTEPIAVPSPPDKLPDGITNKPGGRPTPVYLINPLLETYFQVGNQPAVNQTEGGTDQTRVFGTESCMGCHSSAPVAIGTSVAAGGEKTAIWGGQLSGEFSWLLRQRATFKK